MSLLLLSALFYFLVWIDVDMVSIKSLLNLFYTFKDYMESYPQVYTYKYMHLNAIEAGLVLPRTNNIFLRSMVG